MLDGGCIMNGWVWSEMIDGCGLGWVLLWVLCEGV